MSAIQPHQKAAETPHRPSVKVAGARSDKRHAGDGKPEYLDLCSTCVHASTCGFPRNGDGPVHFCEEFDTEMNEPALAVVHDQEKAHKDAAADREKYPGICSTCEKRDTCRFPKPEGGVWQCEEFE